MRIFFSVGEPSGDLHASNLIRFLHQRSPSIECCGFGGPKMRAAGCQLHFELTQFAVMYLSGVLKNLRKFFFLIGQAEYYFKNYEVDAVVLIDYSGFNWWIAKKAKAAGIPVFYYGVPQVWAWAPWRIRKIKKYVDHVLCKLPFETPWFNQRGCNATYVGHPYFDQMHSQEYDQDSIDRFSEQKPLVVLLPGSRNSEVQLILPLLLKSAEKIAASQPETKFAVACYSEQHQQDVQLATAELSIDIEVVHGKTQELMKAADICIACSGSVSLELMFHRKPTVIVYKTSRLIAFLKFFLMRCKYFTLTNLIASEGIQRTHWRAIDPDSKDGQEMVMPEYYTTSDCSSKVASRVIGWLNDPKQTKSLEDKLAAMASRYAKPGATSRAANYILNELDSSRSVESDFAESKKAA